MAVFQMDHFQIGDILVILDVFYSLLFLELCQSEFWWQNTVKWRICKFKNDLN